MRLHKAIAGVGALLLMTVAGAAEMNDAQVRERIVRESIAAYHGACPCPELSDSRGNACDERSAWSRGGGNRPICYAHEVTDEQVRKFRARQPAG